MGTSYAPRPIARDVLHRLYVEDGKSNLAIARELGTSQRTVCKYMKVHGIKARAFSTKGLRTNVGHKHTAQMRARVSASRKGKRLSPEHRAKVVVTLRRGKGAENPAWRGGLTAKSRLINNRLRGTRAMKLWREAVKDRDGRKCVLCGASEVPLHADHIKSFARHAELRCDLANGRTLCVPCHRATPTYGAKSRKVNP